MFVALLSSLRDRTPAQPPRPSYAVAPSVISEATTARGEQAGRRNPRAATVAHRGPPRDSDALPGGDASGRHARSAAGLPPFLLYAVRNSTAVHAVIHFNAILLGPRVIM